MQILMAGDALLAAGLGTIRPGMVAGRPVSAATRLAPAAGPIVAHDPAMIELLQRVERIAPSAATVLITGESGTGKELVAAHLHRVSGRQGGPFIAINCAAIPEAMLESELFGHEAGAFPGATALRIGRFEAADGGTLLLDEIGEMDIRLQAKLLRTLQEREVDRVGGSSPVRVDVRIVATTSHNLVDEVRAGRFRADLFFRLNVVTVKVPPLRERPADIGPLSECFASHYAVLAGRPALPLSAQALAALQAHGWPGNVRELENVIHRAVLTETGAEIGPTTLDIDAPDLIERLQADASTEQAPAAHKLPHENGSEVHTAGRTIGAVEKDMILATLCRCQGNRAKTAVVLGISIRTLRNKLNEYERDGTPIPRAVVVAVA